MTTTALTFPTPIAGLSPLRDYTLAPVPDTDGVYALQSVDRPEIRFHILNAATHIPAYQPLPNTDDLDVFVIVTAQRGHDRLHVNLLAPIVVNRTAGTAEQVILPDPDRYPLDVPLTDLIAA
ncbi:flagellar assembly protein FliW [Curtobacterium sp. MCBD17_040]|uniref:flagellar assembly protein FliW n=1 Tax=Curtobacterium sp. MCBD17_040 TaxID=2175674 RepID=UPI000DAAA478|nr:flagellar assembly protein FliW [Curtobacterium sp. MCBD17_040]WIB65562.1 flagellar assembly protein FliW [Curtobacterium sp. MCBD17_040]